MKHSTAVSVGLPDFVQEFHSNPLRFRVFLPNGELAVVRKFEDTSQGRLIKVQGIHKNGRFRKLECKSAWFSPDELEILIYSASINDDWPKL